MLVNKAIQIVVTARERQGLMLRIVDAVNQE
jgi:hypothetical protein